MQRMKAPEVRPAGAKGAAAAADIPGACRQRRHAGTPHLRAAAHRAAAPAAASAAVPPHAASPDPRRNCRRRPLAGPPCGSLAAFPCRTMSCGGALHPAPKRPAPRQKPGAERPPAITRNRPARAVSATCARALSPAALARRGHSRIRPTARRGQPFQYFSLKKLPNCNRGSL